MSNNVFITLSCYDLRGLRGPWYIKNLNNGIGNILFQVASGLSYAYENNAKLFVPCLNTYLSLEDLNKNDTIFRHIDTNIVEGFNELNCIWFPSSDSYIFDQPFYNNIHFSGYLENFNNFDKHKSMILNYFRPSELDKKYLIDKYPIITDESISSLHIRMGPDIQQIYSTYEKTRRLLTYYKLIDHMINYKNINKFMVLTNDKAYCKNILNIEKYKNIDFYYSDEINGFNDIWIISLIKNNIFSFSTFSLWGSYLNENEDRYIIGSDEIVKNKLRYKEWVYI